MKTTTRAALAATAVALLPLAAMPAASAEPAQPTSHGCHQIRAGVTPNSEGPVRVSDRNGVWRTIYPADWFWANWNKIEVPRGYNVSGYDITSAGAHINHFTFTATGWHVKPGWKGGCPGVNIRTDLTLVGE